MSNDEVYLGADVCRDLQQAESREWWLTNGIGGYASGTVAGVLSRRYHGLLVAPLHPPLGRYLLFAKADAVLIDKHRETCLHANRWGGGAVDPRGYENTAFFRLDNSMPVWRFEVDGLGIEQRIWMDHGENRTHVAYRWVDGEREEAPRIRVGLIASFRDHHWVSAPGGFSIYTEALVKGLRLHLPEGRYVDIHSEYGTLVRDDTWIENFYLALEHERGMEEIDAHLRVGFVDISLEPGQWCGISIGLDGIGDGDLDASLAAEQARRAALAGPDDAPSWIRELTLAADAFLFHRRTPGEPDKASVIAGYPWFGDWGRDTMIALPGLTLATGRYDFAKDILQTFAGYVSEGMLPNVFPGHGETPEYNTVDAALWYIEAWRAWLEITGDRATLEAVFPVLADVIQAYRDGTRFGIQMDSSDGLIRAGEPGQQLTWMDARVNGREVTPRHGKPVEINALWYNALRGMEQVASALGQPADEFSWLADNARKGFSRFQRDGDVGLYDVLDGPDGNDATIRPNQIFAVSLPFPPLDDEKRRRTVVAECREHLLTPYGLRSLSPSDDRYVGRYIGGVAERDGSYHQGPVWGWLLGHYTMAEYRLTGDADAARRRLEPIVTHLSEAGLGQVSEIFDGDAPHTPRGAPAQAWSVACTLEAWWRLSSG